VAGLLLVAWCLREDVQPDLYFHLAAGRWILAHGPPHTNVFLGVFPEHAFVDHEWLFQVGTWLLHQAGGPRALTVVKTLTVAGSFAALAHVARGRGPRLRWAVLLAAVTVAGGRFILRPEVISLLGVALHVAALSHARGRPSRRVVFGLAGFQLVWANVHGFSLLGIALVLGTLLAGFAHQGLARAGLAGRLGRPPGREGLSALGLLLGLELVAACLNPYGLRGALYPLEIFFNDTATTENAGLTHRIVELTSPFHPSLRGLPEIRLVLGWAAAAPLLYGVALWRGRARLEEGVMALLLAAVVLLYLRNLPFAAVGLFLPTVAGLGALAEAACRSPRLGELALRARTPATAATAAVGLLLAGGVLDDRWHRNASYDARAGLGLGDFPTYRRASDFLDAEPPAAALFNNFGAGHYLLYARGDAPPKPSICGNTDLYPRAWLRRYRMLLTGEAPLLDELELLGVSDVLLDHRVEVEASVLRTLLRAPDWGLVHADPHALVFRRGAEDLSAAELAAAVEAGAAPWRFVDEEPDRFGPSALLRRVGVLGARQVEPIGRLNVASLLELLGQVGAARRQARRAQALAPNSPLVLQTLADLEHYHGEPAEARALWERLAALRPRDPLPQVKLGLLDLRSGRAGARAAERRFRSALDLDPDSRLARENLLTALEVQGDPVELRRALAATPELRPAKRHYFAGAAALAEGDLARAEEGFSAALAADPGLSPAQALLAQVLGRLGRLPEAETAWSRLCALTPRDASAWRALGQVRHLLEREELALLALHRAAEVDPAEVQALLIGAELLLDAGEPNRALEWVRRALERAPQDRRVLDLYQRVSPKADD
jgi:tetratricopeptide (TPR) repeat protein